MSKNTGTSELINYFDLGVNGDVGIAGSLDINTIANATTDTDTFLVSDTGIIKYRTGAQLLSDIGAAPAVAGGYVPYTGATTNVDLGVYNLTASAIIANGSGSNSGIVHLESNAIHSLVNGYGSIASGTTNQFNLYQTTGAGVFRGAILSLNSITEFATRTFTLPDSDGTIALTSQIPANPVGGTGTSGTIPVFTGSTTIGNSIIQSNATQVNVVGNGSQLLFDSLGASKSGGIQYTNDFELLINNSRGVGSAIYLGNVNMDFHTNVSGNPRLRITSGGNILVGTTTDNGAKLQLGGFSGAVNQNNGIKLTNNVGTIVGLEIGGSNDSYIGTISASNFSIRTANTPIITAASSGNVGIGTSSPNANSRLHVYRGGGSYDTIVADGDAGTNTGFAIYEGGSPRYALYSNGAGGNDSFNIYNFGAAANSLTILTSGNVGIGTSSPVNKLSVLVDGGGADDGIRIGVGSQGDGIKIVQRYLSDRVVATLGQSKYGVVTDSGALRLYDVGGTETVRLSGKNGYSSFITSGNVLIGTTTDSGFKLTVNGSLRNGDASTYWYSGADNTGMYMETVGTTTSTRRLRIQGVNNAGTSYSSILLEAGISEIAFLTADTERMRINSSGNVTISGSGNTLLVSSNNNSLSIGVGFQGVTSGYIGGISSALYGYSTNGGYVLLNSSSAWVPASDIKRKRNFEPYTKGLSAILGLQPKLYNMDFQKDGDEKQVGLVAQEVREFIPLAYEENADFIGINYNAIIVTMVKAIQEQQQQIQELKNKLS